MPQTEIQHARAHTGACTTHFVVVVVAVAVVVAAAATAGERINNGSCSPC